MHPEDRAHERRPSVLHPTDCGPSWRSAYNEVVDLARALRARVHLLHVIPGDSEWSVSFQVASLHAFTEFPEVEREDPDRVLAGSSIGLGPVAETIAATARRLDVSMIVMRAERRGRLRSLAHGSLVRELQRVTSVPVCLVRASDGRDVRA